MRELIKARDSVDELAATIRQLLRDKRVPLQTRSRLADTLYACYVASSAVERAVLGAV